MMPTDGVILRRTAPGDLQDLLQLWNDGEVMKHVGFPDGIGYDLTRMQRWLERLEASETRHHYVIVHPTIGFCGETYYSADMAHGRAELDIKLAVAARSRGIATMALTQLISIVFETERTIESVWVEPRDENAAAHRLYRRCGLCPKDRPEDLGPGPSYWERRRHDAWATLDLGRSRPSVR